MKTIILFLFLSLNLFAQSSLLTLFNDDAIWTPEDLGSSLVLWTQATNLTSPVSTWADLSGNGNDLVNGAGWWTKPTWAGEGNGVVFTADAFVGLTATFTLEQPVTTYIVTNIAAWANGSFVIDGGTAYSMSVRGNTSSPEFSLQSGSVLGNISLTLNSTIILQAVSNGTSSSLRMNDGTPLVGDAGTSAPSGFTIGSSQVGDAGIGEEVFEILVIQGTVSAGTDAKILKYFNDKYSVY